MTKTITDRIIGAFCECHDESKLWTHVAEDPGAFRRAIEHVLAMSRPLLASLTHEEIDLVSRVVAADRDDRLELRFGARGTRLIDDQDAKVTPVHQSVLGKIERSLDRQLAPLTPQPAPTATDRTPAWELVATDMVENGLRDQFPTAFADMASRDLEGRVKYGVPLTSGNGRDHLFDAYQELLDLVVYLRTELDEAEHRGDLEVPHTAGINRRDIAVTTRMLYGKALEGACLVRNLLDTRAKVDAAGTTGA